MGNVSLSQQNRLFWLGRYSERVFTNLQLMLDYYDSLIDGVEMDYRLFCSKMGIACPYENGDDFWHRYLFDENDPCSVLSSVENMLGNGMLLRETITTPTLAYIQMARNAMRLAAESESPMVELQWVMDDIMAFRGSFDDSVDTETIRNIAKSGGTVERISVMLRLNWKPERLSREIQKLLNRLYKTDLPVDAEAMETVSRYAINGEEVDPAVLLNSVERLFRV